MKIHLISLSLLLLLFLTPGKAQDKQAYKIGLVGFYNIENLFDTIDDPIKNDEEFLPNGVNQWNTEKYLNKLHNMAYAISTIGTDYTPDGVAVLGLSEIENRHVIEDMVAQPELADRNYQIVHYDSPDRRGVDVALIYNPKYLKVTGTKSYTTVVPGEPDFITRDQLLVSGLFDGEPMHFIVMHWPSRYGGEKRSMPGRVAAATLSCRYTGYPRCRARCPDRAPGRSRPSRAWPACRRRRASAGRRASRKSGSRSSSRCRRAPSCR